MFRTYGSREEQKKSNDSYAESIAMQICRMVSDCSGNILSQNAKYASDENCKELIRFMRQVKKDFDEDMNTQIKNLEISFFGKEEQSNDKD